MSGGGDLTKVDNSDTLNENHHLKSTFKPIDQSQSSGAESNMERISNIDPVKVSDTIHEINLRSIVAMDNEP